MLTLTNKNSYSYKLPKELIAQNPVNDRKSSRLLILNKKNKIREHKFFSDIIEYFKKGDVLVLNTTKVFPARLIGFKETGAKVEIFLLNQINNSSWEALVRPGKKLPPESKIIFDSELSAKIVSYADNGARIVKFSWEGDFWDKINNVGKVPLPPYIERESNDKDKLTYQTIYAEERGSVAAPTAGLHFTEKIIKDLKDKGVIICNVLLHVGLGTFRPVKTDDILKHEMHREYCEIKKETADIINKAKNESRRVIAVGTTTTRTLESFADNGKLLIGSKWTDLFLYPGKKIQIIDGLITNFHMPESTLLMLVSAFAGYDFIMNSYKLAVDMKYRFFSYGDAMFIF